MGGGGRVERGVGFSPCIALKQKREGGIFFLIAINKQTT